MPLTPSHHSHLDCMLRASQLAIMMLRGSACVGNLRWRRMAHERVPHPRAAALPGRCGASACASCQLSQDLNRAETSHRLREMLPMACDEHIHDRASGLLLQARTSLPRMPMDAQVRLQLSHRQCTNVTST